MKSIATLAKTFQAGLSPPRVFDKSSISALYGVWSAMVTVVTAVKLGYLGADN